MRWLVDLVVLCTFTLEIAVVESLSSGDACKTLIDTDGICQPLKNCSTLQNIIRNPDHQQRLESLECGDGKVCCPKLTNSPSCGILHKEEDKLGWRRKRFNHPWTALIFYDIEKNRNVPRCGGTLISERHVITNALCTMSRKLWKLLFVRFNEYNTNSPDNCTELRNGESICREDYVVESIIPHNEISILRLATDVNFQNHVRPICLPLDVEVQQLPILSDTTFIGVRWDDMGFERSTGLPTYDTLTVLDNEVCNSVYRPMKIVLTSDQMCLRLTQSSCIFISGGPLMREVENVWYIVGIDVFLSGACASRPVPKVYTTVAKDLKWLEIALLEDRYLKL